MTEELEQYILHHIDEEGTYLSKLVRDTNLKTTKPRMCSGHLQGRILKMLCQLVNPSLYFGIRYLHRLFGSMYG
jgi:hypothetical protein